MPQDAHEKLGKVCNLQSSENLSRFCQNTNKPEALLLDSVPVPVLGLGSLAESGALFTQCSGQITDFWLAGFNRFSVLGLKLNLGE